MGNEYRITCTSEAVSRIAALVVRLGAEKLSSEKEMFEIRFRPESTHDMPDAVVVLERESVYFCAYAHSPDASHFFLRLIDEALTYSDSSDSVQITAL